MKKTMTLFILALPLLIWACATDDTTRDSPLRTRGPVGRTTPGSMEPDTTYINAGDSVSLSVWGYPEFSMRSIVKITGTITVPLIGEQVAAGMKKEELIQQLRWKLAEYIKGEVKLSLDVDRPQPRITILGSVVQAGSFPATTDIPLLEALARVGGWTEQSELRYIRINRQLPAPNEGSAVEVNLTWYMDRGNTRALPMIRPGDVVVVPRKENFVREVSDFMRDAILLLGVFRIFN